MDGSRCAAGATSPPRRSSRRWRAAGPVAGRERLSRESLKSNGRCREEESRSTGSCSFPPRARRWKGPLPLTGSRSPILSEPSPWWGDAPASLAAASAPDRLRGALVRDGAHSRLPPLDRIPPDFIRPARFPSRRPTSAGRSTRRGVVVGARGADGAALLGSWRGDATAADRGAADTFSSPSCWRDAPAIRCASESRWHSRSSRSRRGRFSRTRAPPAPRSRPAADAAPPLQTEPIFIQTPIGLGLRPRCPSPRRAPLSPRAGKPAPGFTSLARLAALSALIIDALALASSGRRGRSGKTDSAGAALHRDLDRLEPRLRDAQLFRSCCCSSWRARSSTRSRPLRRRGISPCPVC